MQLQVYKAQIDPSLTSDLEVSFIGLVDKPAIEKNFQAFKDQQHKLKFVLSEERQIISGPAMLADMLLYRNDSVLGEYYVQFDKPSIQTIVQKFCAKGFMQKFNLFHDDNLQTSDVTMFNCFITDKELGIQPPKGFEDAPDGSWFISAQCGPITWPLVKSGQIKGFSVEGIFSYMPIKTVKMSDEQRLDAIKRLLSET